MQLTAAVSLSLLLAHLVGDFPLQSNWIASRKGTRPAAMLAHIAVHYATACASLLLFAPKQLWSGHDQAVLLAYLAAHLAIDLGKSRLVTRHIFPNNGTLFLLDQAAHIATVGLAALALTGAHLADVYAAISISPRTKSYLLVAGIVYVAVIFGGGYLIAFLTEGLEPNPTEEPATGKSIGTYIGWIERFLVITAVAVQSPALIGLILTGKSIARFPEMKKGEGTSQEGHFAEYFLVGTFLSISLAVVGGRLLDWMAYGTLSLK